jgi:hypothetical protein
MSTNPVYINKHGRGKNTSDGKLMITAKQRLVKREEENRILSKSVPDIANLSTTGSIYLNDTNKKSTHNDIIK